MSWTNCGVRNDAAVVGVVRGDGRQHDFLRLRDGPDRKVTN